jgi:ABC-type nitrate/sulfonate/bicarbonate transport system substrate-binding protein
MPSGADGFLLARPDWLEDNRDAAVGIGRAIAEATEWSSENSEGVLDICEKYVPEEVQDRTFASDILGEVMKLTELPSSANGLYGTTPLDDLATSIETFQRIGAIDKEVPIETFTNDLVEASNE